jgi:oxygen-independent coproporphyrinogen-3 oxidase
LRAHIIERLMCDLTLDLGAIAGGTARFASELAALAPLAEAGLLTLSGGKIAITERGRPYVRIAAAAFDSYLAESRKQHSVAV